MAEDEARQLGVARDVHFLGRIDLVAPLLADADLFLLPSRNESFGLSALEALASGVPVIATRTGGLPEVVNDGKNGFLCGVGDIEGMSAVALRLLRDEAEWKRLSEAGVRDARERFAVEPIVSQYESLYEDAINGAGKPS